MWVFLERRETRHSTVDIRRDRSRIVFDDGVLLRGSRGRRGLRRRRLLRRGRCGLLPLGRRAWLGLRRPLLLSWRWFGLIGLVEGGAGAGGASFVFGRGVVK